MCGGYPGLAKLEMNLGPGDVGHVHPVRSRRHLASRRRLRGPLRNVRRFLHVKHELFALNVLEAAKKGAPRGVFNVEKTGAGALKVANFGQGPKHARGRDLERRRPIPDKRRISVEEVRKLARHVGEGIEIGASDLIFGKIDDDVEKGCGSSRLDDEMLDNESVRLDDGREGLRECFNLTSLSGGGVLLHGAPFARSSVPNRVGHRDHNVLNMVAHPGARSRMRHVTKGLARRGFLAGILAAPLLASCTGPTRIAIGQRETYTPPPPGIDEIYRTELLTSVTDLAGILETARPHEDFPSFLTSAIATHQRALRTGAEQEKIASAEANRTEKGGSAHESAAAGTQAPVERAMLDAARGLAALRDLYAHATIQVSGDFADLCAAGSAWTEWAALRLTRVAKAAAVAGVSAPKPFTDMEPSREVPAIDPPEAAETHLIETPLERAQTDENFAAYALEVAATRVKADQREAYLKAANVHASRAETFGEVAEHLGLPLVAREAGYALPRPLDAEGAANLRLKVTSRTLTNAVELAGLAPLSERAPFLTAALESAKALEALRETLPPFPGIDEGES